ncbi:VOC family protein [Kocuria oceani]|uniref:VOC family protein n=1 Tax=Kocuria oceani TaxID=988827 RepID=A0ABV9TMB3_9MICC|nr:VOC family protein [Kocuria oceani]
MITADYVALPVADLDRARRFYARLGWELGPPSRNVPAGATMLVRGAAHVMVLSEDRHRHPVGPESPGTAADSSVVTAIDVESPADVDAVVERAVRAGATEGEIMDYGFLRSRGFQAPDGHHWEVLWVDQAPVRAGGAGEQPWRRPS